MISSIVVCNKAVGNHNTLYEIMYNWLFSLRMGKIRHIDVFVSILFFKCLHVTLCITFVCRMVVVAVAIPDNLSFMG